MKQITWSSINSPVTLDQLLLTITIICKNNIHGAVKKFHFKSGSFYKWISNTMSGKKTENVIFGQHKSRDGTYLIYHDGQFAVGCNEGNSIATAIWRLHPLAPVKLPIFRPRNYIRWATKAYYAAASMCVCVAAPMALATTAAAAAAAS